MTPPLIILTTTVHVQNKIYLYQTDVNERIQVYVKKIREWLSQTSLPILVVENTGYSFPELEEEKEKFAARFEIITYIEDELPECDYLKGNPYKGASEIFSIHWGYLKTKLAESREFIIKITGRYFIPEFEKYLEGYDLNMYDVIVQHKKNRCEMLGCHRDHFNKVFDLNLITREGNYSGHVEEVYEFRCEQYANIIHCPVFPIEGTQRGGIDEVFYDV
jgi:hypothetical protein